MLAGIAGAGIISATNDVLQIITTIVAVDYVNGGPAGVAAGDPATLELGRFLGMMSFGLFTPIAIASGLGFASLGYVISFMPQGAVNPPRWIGWVAIACALAGWLSPLVMVNGVLFVFLPMQLLTSLVVLIALGGWLITRGERVEEAMTRAAAQPGLAS
jgi:hypothetical protein